MSVGLPTYTDSVVDSSAATQADKSHSIDEVLNSVQEAIAPVWPLKDYVAVNPYGGLSGEPFLEARTKLQSVSDCETLMPLGYYRGRFAAGKFGLSEIEAAVDELVEDQVPGAELLCANAIYKLLSANHESEAPKSSCSVARIQPISECYDQSSGTSWSEVICEEISKHCSAHYDEGQASWASPWKGLSLYQAWQAAAQRDRKIEILGLREFREVVKGLPASPQFAIVSLLRHAEVPEALWKDYLLSLSLSLPGWSAWAKYQAAETAKQGDEQSDFIDLLAIRLAYDVALSLCFDFKFGTNLFAGAESEAECGSDSDVPDALLRFTLLRANEIGFRSSVLSNLDSEGRDSSQADEVAARKLAQMVFCIDVRSERFRRNLEAVSDEVETFGFAGFFGIPFEFVRLGEEAGTNQLPVLIDPQFKVYQEVRSSEQAESDQVKERRGRLRLLRRAWKRLQTSALSCFAYVETTGIFYGGVLLRKALGYRTATAEFDGVNTEDQCRLSPSFRDLHRQGVTTSRQVDIAESILTNMGLTDNFARLVVLCGHTSQTENNPLQASLDCGACGGHSGEANARFGAMLLNQPHVRSSLAERGIDIPADTQFLAGVHNTTTDQISFFDLDLLPRTHFVDLDILQSHTRIAGSATRSERLPLLPGQDEESLLQRSKDWSEVRPEWGLSGNAAFIVGRRELTKSYDLQGRAFLHSYDACKDAEGRVLEQIMTAPMVVANWINMQYYASTVDQKHFGSGEKTIHNVVGKFGLLSGNGGDLQTGLPWQSLHDGDGFQHDPVRLLCVIEAPRAAIERVIASHENVRDLIVNGWVQLVAFEDESFHRYSAKETWETLEIEPSESIRQQESQASAEVVNV